MKQATKKQQQAFYEDVLEYIVTIGAKNTHKGPLCSEYKITTIAGVLNISLEEPERSAVFTIFCRFEDVKKANEVLQGDARLNPYSGKWNWHEYTACTLLDGFKKSVTNILPTN